MPKSADISTFYLQPAAGNPDKCEYHFMDWRRIIELFHPSNATNDLTKSRYYEVCIKRLEAALTEQLKAKKSPEEIQEIKDIKASIERRYSGYAK
jgi:hypothetical protein